MRAVFLDYDSLRPADLDATPLIEILPELALHAASTPAQVLERVRDAEIVLLNKARLPRELLENAPQLRLVCLAATGIDNVDLDAARERGVGVCNIRAYCTPSVVQHVFALLLELTQHLSAYRRQVAQGEWSRSTSFCLLDPPFRELADKNFGIVGFGALGTAVGRVAEAFGMRVIAAKRPYRLNDDSPAQADASGIARAGFGRLLRESDVISLHCPLTDDTRRLISAEALNLMRKDSILINTARGGLVEPAALLEALGKGRIGGAGIDVIDQEPPPPDDLLVHARQPNLVLTPHIAWAAREARQRAVDELAANIRAFLRGERRNRLD